MKKILITVIMASLFTSCEKYLDVKPYGRTVPKTAEEFSALIHAQLYNMDEGNFSSALLGNLSELTSLDAVSGDDFETCLTKNSGRSLRIYAGDIVTNSGNYSQLYQTIRDCNIVLDEMKEQGTELSDKLRATAYAMRAVCYYQLLKYYCEVPEVGRMSTQLGVPLVTHFNMEYRPIRSSMQATVDLIESDLNKSIAYHNTDDLYRFTEYVCKGYLARLYFWTKQWDKVLPLTKELLVKYPILPINEFQTVMKKVNELGKNQLIKAYRTSNTTGQQFNLDTDILKYRPVSLRYLTHFLPADTANDVRYKFYVSRSRVLTKPFFSGMRSEEFKLMEAECYYHLGRKSEALASLNDLRSARIAHYTPMTEADLPDINSKEIIKVDATGASLTPLIAAILSERRKELFFEGDRFFEQKRNGAPEYWTAYNGSKYTTRKFMYTYPIPSLEIEITSGLVQNPGYTEFVSN